MNVNDTVNKPRPEVQNWSKPFWDNCRKEKLTIQKCRDCGKYVFYPKLACPECLTENMEWVEVSGKGKVYTFSAPEPVMMPYLAPAFANDTPFVVAIIELEEGVRMCSNIVQCAIEDIHCDMPVEVVFEKLDDEFNMPKFKPAAKGK